MLRRLYLSHIGYFMSLFIGIIGRIKRPFMIYGYWNRSRKSFFKNTRISSSTILIDRRTIDIDDDCWIGPFCIIDGSNGIKIGRGVQIAGHAAIYTHSSHVAIRMCGRDYISIPASKRVGYIKGSVEIGDYTFIASSVVILPGVRIGKGVIIGAFSLVNKDVPDYSIVNGCPARKVGDTRELDRKVVKHSGFPMTYYDN